MLEQGQAQRELLAKHGLADRLLEEMLDGLNRYRLAREAELPAAFVLTRAQVMAGRWASS